MDRRKFVHIYIFMIIFTFIMYVGYKISNYGCLDYRLTTFILAITGCLVISFILTYLLCWLIKRFIKVDIHDEKKTMLDDRSYLFAYSFISFVPALLAYYPSIWSYDIHTQIEQIFNTGYSRYHPLLHTLLVDICLKIGDFIFSSYTIGALLYSLVQMIILASCFSFAMWYVFNKFKMNKTMKVIVLLFYLIMPFNAIMSISTTKDTIFAGLTLVLIIYLYEYFMNDRKTNIKLLIIIILWFSFRNNAYFAFLGFSLFVLCLFWQNKRTILASISIIILVNFGFNIFLDKGLNAESISSAELISIPGTQIARAAVYSKDNFTADELQLLDDVFEDSYTNYNPYLFDDVKLEMNFSATKMAPLMKLWFKLLPKCLPEYIDAFLCMNVGSWYPLDKTYTRIYIDNYENGRLLSGSLNDVHQGYLQTKQFESLDIQFANKMNLAHDYYEAICSLNYGQEFILMQILLSPASYLWVLIGLLFYCIYQRDKYKAIPLVLLLLYWATMLLGPCTLFRYMYPIVVCTPICACIVLLERKVNLDDK